MTHAAIEPGDERYECLAIWDQRKELFPVLGNLCPLCASARRRVEGICGLCQALRERHGRALGRLYVIGVADEECRAYRWVADWKDYPTKRGPKCFVDVVLSLWWEQHEEYILGRLDDPLLTTVGTHHRVIGEAVEACKAEGWPAPDLEEFVEKAPGVVPQRLCGRDVRLRKEPKDWLIHRDVEGRDIVLFDDVYVTGASMHSLARALKDAGAASVEAVAFLRHLTGDAYFEELQRRRLRCEPLGMPLLWTPDQLWYSAR